MTKFGKNSNFINLLVNFLVAIAIAAPARAAVVKYTELTAKRLPYGEPITITGKLSDLKRGNTKLESIMDIQSISLNYQVSGLAEKSVKAAITANSWAVAVEKLPEKSVRFTFQIIGQLNEKTAGEVVDNLMKNPEFGTAFQTENFTKNIELFLYHNKLPELKTEAKETLTRRFPRSIGAPIRSQFNIDDLEGRVSGVKKGMALSTVHDTIQAAINNNIINEEMKKKAEEFLSNYQREKAALLQTIQTDISVKTDLLSVTEIKDFEKFAGIDVGAIYLPKIDELRSFYTVNIYLGTVEDTPTPVTSTQSNEEKVGRFLKQRLSLTFGLSISDISSGMQKEIKGNKAFLYGLGFRINKYFRITVGRSLYRTTQGDSLRQTRFVGPSIDISGLPLLRTLIGNEKQ